MKKFRNLIVAALALVMVFAMSITASAASINIHTPANAKGQELEYKVYKVFDATVNGTAISYKLTSQAKALPADEQLPASGTFALDKNGNIVRYVKGSEAAAADDTHTQQIASGEWVQPNTDDLTEDEITAIGTYATGLGITPQTVTYTPTTDNKEVVEVSGLDEGYYYITTSTGSVVTITNRNNTEDINDKNELSDSDKKVNTYQDPVTGQQVSTDLDENGKYAVSQVGTINHYTVYVNLKRGTASCVMTDTLGTGMSYAGNLKVVLKGTTDQDITGDTTKYSVTEPDQSADGGTLTVTFDSEYIKGLCKAINDTTNVDVKFEISYDAKINNTALVSAPLENTAYITTGDGTHNYNTTEDKVYVFNAEINILKKIDSETGDALPGAGFVIKNSAGKYYKLTTENGKSVVTWVDSVDETGTNIDTSGDLTDNEMIHFSNDEGKVAPFTGLGVGTYTIVEYYVHAGYNKASDKNFTVSGTADLKGKTIEEVKNTATTDTVVKDFQASMSQTSTVINKTGQQLPTTGGIGTKLFYMIGAVMVLGAAVVLITRRRMSAK